MLAEELELLANLALVASPAGLTHGAALSAALHCLLVSKGFTVIGPGTVFSVPKHATPEEVRAAFFKTPAGWQSEGPNEWNVDYEVEGCLAPFKLTVALHRNSNRVFVHASEAGNVNNIQVLGLLLDNYIPSDFDLTTATSWHQVLHNTAQLLGNMNEHIITPLLRNAAPGLPVKLRTNEEDRPSATGSSSWTDLWNTVHGGLGASWGNAGATAAAVAAVAVVGGLWLSRTRRH